MVGDRDGDLVPIRSTAIYLPGEFEWRAGEENDKFEGSQAGGHLLGT